MSVPYDTPPPNPPTLPSHTHHPLTPYTHTHTTFQQHHHHHSLPTPPNPLPNTHVHTNTNTNTNTYSKKVMRSDKADPPIVTAKVVSQKSHRTCMYSTGNPDTAQVLQPIPHSHLPVIARRGTRRIMSSFPKANSAGRTRGTRGRGFGHLPFPPLPPLPLLLLLLRKTNPNPSASVRFLLLPILLHIRARVRRHFRHLHADCIAIDDL